MRGRKAGGMNQVLATVFLALFMHIESVIRGSAVQILSKSKLEKCERLSDSGELNCTRKIVLNMAVPSGSSGGEASLVAEIAEVEENSTNKMHTVRIPPVITINKSASYALYELTYIRDVAYKPTEYYVKTRKCEPDADAHVVQICERLRDENGHIIEHTEPICCPCGDKRRVPSSCGNFIDKLSKGKANTAHCLRFPGDWYHIFAIGTRTVGFSIQISVKTGTKESVVFVGPENRTVTSADSFLRVNLIGDFVGYTNIPSFEDFYLVTPRVLKGGAGQPPNLGNNFSMWMLLERVRFTLDGMECNKIGVGFDAFSGQPNFCSSPFWSCLHYQLWNFREADQNRISRHQVPLYVVDGRFERINQHPNAGSHSFSIGITEAVSSNLLIELSADDIEYVYQRSPGKILSITIPTFEALTQSGTATVTVRNIGEVEASYSLTFDCEKSVALMEEQYFILKPKETTTRSFKLYPATDQAASYKCSAILKDSEFNESDRAECQFATTSTVIDNGSQVPFHPPKEGGVKGFFEAIKDLWVTFWNALADFFTGRSCRSKCSGFFDLGCHVQYICMSWVIMFGLFLAIFPTVLVLLWLLHQKGLFDPIYDWWEDNLLADDEPHVRRKRHHDLSMDLLREHHHHKHHRRGKVHHEHTHHARKDRTISEEEQHKHRRLDRDATYNYYLHHVHKDRHKSGRTKMHRNEEEYRAAGHRRRRSETEAVHLAARHHSEEVKHKAFKHK